MLTKERIFELIRENYPYLTKQFGVKRIGLFGSYATHMAGPTSDIDMVVEFQRPIGLQFFDLIEYLEQLLGKKVDILTPAGIQSIRVESVARRIIESRMYV